MSDVDLARQLLERMVITQAELARVRHERLHAQAEWRAAEANEHELQRLLQIAECIERAEGVIPSRTT